MSVSRFGFTKPSPTTLNWCEDNLILDNPNYIKALKSNNPRARFVPKKIYMYTTSDNNLYVPYGAYYKILDLLHLKKVPTPINNKVEYKGKIDLYDYQSNAVKKLASLNNGILVSPAGSGKTQMGIALMQELGLKTLWITHTKDLINQSLLRFKYYYKNDIGEISDGKVNISNSITFATIQTLSKIDLSLYENEWDLIIIDEVQHCSTSIDHMQMYEKVLNHLNAPYRYGLTATLHRADHLEKGILNLVSYNIVKVDENNTRKIKAEVYNILVPTDIPKEKIGFDIITNKPTYAIPYLNTDSTINYAKLVNCLSINETRNTTIVSLVKRLLVEDRHIMILCNLKLQCDLLVNLIPNSVYLDSDLSKINRYKIIENIKKGKEKVIISTYSLAKEGLDMPILDSLILATPQKDETAIIQSIGRIERIYPKKLQPKVYDIIDTTIPYCLGSKKKRNSVLKKYNYKIYN